MEASSERFDIALLALGSGVIILNIILFFIYLLVRRLGDVKARKTDRPLWVAMTVLSGTLWILSSLQIYGTVKFIPNNRYTCNALKFFGQYTFGYILWISATIYRMIRLYMVYTIIAKPLHAAAVVSLLLFPFGVLSAVAVAVMVPKASCDRPNLWNGLLHGFALSYCVLFIYLLLMLLRVIGRLKGLKKYIIFTGISFLFVLFDASASFLHLSNPPIRRGLLLVVILIVAAHTWTIYGFVLKRKSSLLLQEAYPDAQVKLEVCEDTFLPAKQPLFVLEARVLDKKRKRDKLKKGVEHVLEPIAMFFAKFAQIQEESEPDDEIEDRVDHYDVPDNFVMFRLAGTLSKPSNPRFTEFLKQLNPEDRARVMEREGVYRVGNMYSSYRALDLDMCLKYLGDPVDILQSTLVND